MLNQLRAALKNIEYVLGPAAPECGGCEAEIAEALTQARDALSLLRYREETMWGVEYKDKLCTVSKCKEDAEKWGSPYRVVEVLVLVPKD